MMTLLRAVCALFVLGVCSVAQAQVNSAVCYPYGIKGKATEFLPKIVRNANGYYAFWFCDSGRDVVGYYRCIESGRFERYVGDFLPEFLLTIGMSDQAKRQAATEALDAKWSMPSPLNDAICANAKEATKASMPPPPLFVVAKNGTTQTRPTRVFENGQLGSTAAERVDVGSVCNQRDAYMAIGSTIYAAVLGRKDRVAVCQRVSG